MLHASAVACAASGRTVAFTGATHAGKSTTAYGMGRRPGWQPVCDDTLAFSVSPWPANGSPASASAQAPTSSALITLHPIPNDARLRPASAKYYGVPDTAPETLVWPDAVLGLGAVYFLEGDETFGRAAEFERLRVAEALPLLLQQAYALSFKIPKYNQQLMKDYVALAAGVAMFRLRYRRSFDAAEELFAAIEHHLATEAGVVCSRP